MSLMKLSKHYERNKEIECGKTIADIKSRI